MTQKILVLFVVFCLLAPLRAAQAQGQTYYVDPSGSDLSGDGSAGNPWASIVYAAAQVGAGDTVLINPGVYAGGVVVDSGGTPSEPLTFRASGSGVIIEGSGGDRDAFFITYADYVVVEGLTIRHATRAGMRIDNSHHVTVRDCVFADNGTWGLFTDFSDYTTVEDSESYGALGEDGEHGIYISNSSDYPTIRRNRLHHNAACGLHMNGDESQGGDGIISNALVEDNIIYENGAGGLGNNPGGGSGINMDGVTDSIVRNNLLYANHASGISMYQIDGGSGSHDNQVLNNTIWMAADARWAVNIPNPGPVGDDPGNTGNHVYNNILYSDQPYRGSISLGSDVLAGFESDYNVVLDRFTTDDGDSILSLAEWQALGYDAHSFIATPGELFANPAGDDYHLKAGSPAIDAGIFLGAVLHDLEGYPRPAGSTHDIGAYEFPQAQVWDHFLYLPVAIK